MAGQASTTPTSSYKTYLMKGASTGDTYTKIIDIKSVGDLGGKPEALDSTTLSDPAKTYVDGIQSQEALEFEANYTKANLEALKKLEGSTEKYAVMFGDESGVDGKFTFQGRLSAFVKGFGVNEVRAITISITPTTEISFA